jgi:hypothetical protein
MALLSQELVLGGAEIAAGHETKSELLATQHAVQLAGLLDGQYGPGGTGCSSAQRAGHQLLGVHLAGDEQMQQEERVGVDDRRLRARPARVGQGVGAHGHLGRPTDHLDDLVGVQVEPADVPTRRHQERPTAAGESEPHGLLRDGGCPRSLSLYH